MPDRHAIIDHLKIGSRPSIRVIENPNALVIHGETPGQLLLLGAERGEWEVTVTRDDGAQVAYRVDVSAIADQCDAARPRNRPSCFIRIRVASENNQNLYQRTAADRSTSHTPSMRSAPRLRRIRILHITIRDHVPLPETASGVSGRQSFASAVTETIHRRAMKSFVESTGRNYLPADVISMMSGASEIVDFPRRLKRISIADSTIADIQVTSPYQLNLIGHKPGFTTLTIWDDQGHYVEREVRIDAGWQAAGDAQCHRGGTRSHQA